MAANSRARRPGNSVRATRKPSTTAKTPPTGMQRTAMIGVSSTALRPAAHVVEPGDLQKGLRGQHGKPGAREDEGRGEIRQGGGGHQEEGVGDPGDGEGDGDGPEDAPAPRPEAEGGVLEVRVDVGDDG